jgi:hypothetical protein
MGHDALDKVVDFLVPPEEDGLVGSFEVVQKLVGAFGKGGATFCSAPLGYIL